MDTSGTGDGSAGGWNRQGEHTGLAAWGEGVTDPRGRGVRTPPQHYPAPRGAPSAGPVWYWLVMMYKRAASYQAVWGVHAQDPMA